MSKPVTARHITAVLRAAGVPHTTRPTYRTPQGVTIVRGDYVDPAPVPRTEGAPLAGFATVEELREASIDACARVAEAVVAAGYSVSVPFAYFKGVDGELHTRGGGGFYVHR